MTNAKKIIALLLISALIPVFATSCKDQRYGDYDSTGEKYDCYLPDYIEVCDYKGIELPVISTEPTEEDIENRMMQQIALYATRTEEPGRPAQKGDIVDIITTCKFTDTGEEYKLLTFTEKSTGFGQSFCLGTNYFFTKELDNAVIGMTTGETKTVKFSLPDPYYEDLKNSGREVEMEIYLTYTDAIDYSDAEKTNEDGVDFFAEHFSYSEEHYRVHLGDKLHEELEELCADYKVMLTWDYICDNSEMIKVPEKEYKEYYDSKLDADRASAEKNEKTLKEYVAEKYSYDDLDDYYAYIKDYAENKCFEEMILYYIIRCEDLSFTEEYYEEKLLETGEDYQLTDVTDIEDFYDYYYGIESVQEQILFMYAQEWVVDQAKLRDDVNTVYGLYK